MSDHKFQVGSRVSLSLRDRSVRAREYKVVRLLPAEGNEPQYRIKSQAEPAERVAKEYQLRALDTAPG